MTTLKARDPASTLNVSSCKKDMFLIVLNRSRVFCKSCCVTVKIFKAKRNEPDIEKVHERNLPLLSSKWQLLSMVTLDPRRR